MKTLIHKLTNEKEAKTLIYKGKYFIHLIVFNKKQAHYQVINKLKRHFIINDDTCQAGWLINGKQEFYSKRMVNERIALAKTTKVFDNFLKEGKINSQDRFK